MQAVSPAKKQHFSSKYAIMHYTMCMARSAIFHQDFKCMQSGKKHVSGRVMNALNRC